MAWREVYASIPTDSGTFEYDQWADPDAAQGWIAEAMRLTDPRAAQVLDAGGFATITDRANAPAWLQDLDTQIRTGNRWDVQKAWVLRAWTALANVYQSLNLPPMTDPGYGEVMHHWGGWIVCGLAPVFLGETLSDWTYGVGRMDGLMGQRILSLWLATGHPDFTVTGVAFPRTLITRIPPNGTGYDWQGGATPAQVQAANTWLAQNKDFFAAGYPYCRANVQLRVALDYRAAVRSGCATMPSDPMGCGPWPGECVPTGAVNLLSAYQNQPQCKAGYDWFTMVWYSGGTCRIGPMTSPPLRWSFEMAREIAQRMNDRGALQMVQDARLYAAARNAKTAVSYGLITDQDIIAKALESGQQQLTPSYVFQQDWFPEYSAGLGAVTGVIAAINPLAGAVVGAIGAASSFLPIAQAHDYQVDDWCRAGPAFEATFLSTDAQPRTAAPEPPQRMTPPPAQPPGAHAAPPPASTTGLPSLGSFHVPTSAHLPTTLGVSSVTPTLPTTAEQKPATTPGTTPSAPATSSVSTAVVVGGTLLAAGGLAWALWPKGRA
jgi:hypothetical protein